MINRNDIAPIQLILESESGRNTSDDVDVDVDADADFPLEDALVEAEMIDDSGDDAVSMLFFNY